MACPCGAYDACIKPMPPLGTKAPCPNAILGDLRTISARDMMDHKAIEFLDEHPKRRRNAQRT